MKQEHDSPTAEAQPAMGVVREETDLSKLLMDVRLSLIKQLESDRKTINDLARRLKVNKELLELLNDLPVSRQDHTRG